MRNGSGERLPRADGLDAALSKQEDASCWYLTLGGCPVTVSPNDQGDFEYRCQGCGAQQNDVHERVLALSQADDHASKCRATRDPRAEDAAYLAREISAEVRAELPSIDARAAAGIALSAAVLIGVVGQPQPMPILVFMVVAAALLTIALLLFFTVLLPVPGEAGRASIRRWATLESGQALVDQLTGKNRAIYHATAAVELSSVVRTKHIRLMLGLYAGGLAVLTLAAGATYSLFLVF